MKNCIINAGKVYFLNFIFNPNLRTLQHNGTVLQLRKKQSEVLALLCQKYPEPVSQSEFLAEVWRGGYVTSQSIAQIIRSLRISIGDDTKNIIVTIPKLGYQLCVQPRWEENTIDSDISNLESLPHGNISFENPTVSTQSMINITPISNTSMSVVPSCPQKSVSTRKRLSPQTLFFCAIGALFYSLICDAMTDRDDHLDFITYRKSFAQQTLNDFMTPISNKIFYCCKTNEGVTCNPEVTPLRRKCINASSTAEGIVSNS